MTLAIGRGNIISAAATRARRPPPRRNSTPLQSAFQAIARRPFQHDGDQCDATSQHWHKVAGETPTSQHIAAEDMGSKQHQDLSKQASFPAESMAALQRPIQLKSTTRSSQLDSNASKHHPPPRRQASILQITLGVVKSTLTGRLGPGKQSGEQWTKTEQSQQQQPRGSSSSHAPGASLGQQPAKGSAQEEVLGEGRPCSTTIPGIGSKAPQALARSQTSLGHGTLGNSLQQTHRQMAINNALFGRVAPVDADLARLGSNNATAPPFATGSSMQPTSPPAFPKPLMSLETLTETYSSFSAWASPSHARHASRHGKESSTVHNVGTDSVASIELGIVQAMAGDNAPLEPSINISRVDAGRPHGQAPQVVGASGRAMSLQLTLQNDRHSMSPSPSNARL